MKPMEQIVIDKDKKFKFKCKKCGFCCNFAIILYPFDIMNICRHLNIKTKEFLEKYAVIVPDENKIMRCVLKKAPKCLFNKDNLCTIYNARPVRCRLFPIGRYFEDNKVEYLLPRNRCIGFNSNKKQSVKEWVNDQDASQFDDMANEWSNFIIRLKNGNYPLEYPKFRIMFIKIFYDFDNDLIKNYKEKMDVKTDKEFMQLLYTIAEETLFKLAI